jgi:hypothetical protein
LKPKDNKKENNMTKRQLAGVLVIGSLMLGSLAAAEEPLQPEKNEQLTQAYQDFYMAQACDPADEACLQQKEVQMPYRACVGFACNYFCKWDRGCEAGSCEWSSKERKEVCQCINSKNKFVYTCK